MVCCILIFNKLFGSVINIWIFVINIEASVSKESPLTEWQTFESFFFRHMMWKTSDTVFPETCVCVSRDTKFKKNNNSLIIIGWFFYEFCFKPFVDLLIGWNSNESVKNANKDT